MEQKFSNLERVMEPETISKNGASPKIFTSRTNIKYIIVLLMGSFLMQSCVTTRYVSEAESLRKKFSGSTVDDIEFVFGKPNNVSETRTGYVYTYYYYYKKPLTLLNINKERKVETYRRFSFDNNNNLRYIQSTNTVPKTEFDGGNTAFIIIFFTVILPGIIILLAVNQTR